MWTNPVVPRRVSRRSAGSAVSEDLWPAARGLMDADEELTRSQQVDEMVEQFGTKARDVFFTPKIAHEVISAVVRWSSADGHDVAAVRQIRGAGGRAALRLADALVL